MKTLNKIWKAYATLCFIGGHLVVIVITLNGLTLTIGKREFVWKGIFHYTLLPIMEWFWKV